MGKNLELFGLFANYIFPFIMITCVIGFIFIKKKMNWGVPVKKEVDSNTLTLDSSENLVLIDDIKDNMFITKNGVHTAGIKTEDSDFYTLTFEEQEHVAKNYINMFASCNRHFTKFIINKEVVLDDLIDTHVKAYENITKSINDIDYVMTELKDMYEKRIEGY